MQRTGGDARAAGGASRAPSAAEAQDVSAPSDVERPPCRNCGSPDIARFCPHCGQEAVSLETPSIEVLRTAIADATDIDGRLLRTARALLVPGELTVAWLAGRRVPYVSPVKLFLAAGTALTATWITTRGIDARFYGLPADAYVSATTYIDAVVRSALWAIGLLSMCSWFLGLTRRRLVDEIVFALHLVSALMFGATLSIALGTGWKLVWGTTKAVPDIVPALPFLLFAPATLAGVVYVYLATRAVHDGPWWAALFRTVFLTGAGVQAFMYWLARMIKG